MRAHAPPVIGYISGACYKLDLRTVFPFQDDILVDAIRSACAAGANDAELKTALVIFGTELVEPLDDVMFAGGKATRDRLRGLKPAARPDLEAALQAVAASPVQIAFVPGDDHRRPDGADGLGWRGRR